MGLDWGDGDYARTADVLGPASRALVEAVGAGPGRRVLDVGCGTGNAAFAAAARGARCVGVDVSPGLVAQARRRAAAAGAAAEFVVGDAAALPVADGSFDAAVSAFGVIFAEEPAAAMAEMARAVRPGGAVALATWLPEGPIATAGRLLRAALPPGDAPAARWDDLGWVRDLLAAAGLRDVRAARAGEVAFTAASPEAWLSEQEDHHPVWRWACAQLGAEGWEPVRAATLAALAEGNERPGGFLVTSGYAIASGTR